MKYSEAMEYLQNLIGFKPSAKEIVNILGLSSPKILYQRAHRDSEFSDLELKTLENHYCRPANPHCSNISDLVTIKYMRIPGIEAEVLQSPYIEKQLRFDRELVQNDWQRDPDCQRIVRMRGDKMDGGFYPLKNNDILMIDISKTSIIESAVYIYTTCFQGHKEVFISRVNIRPDGNVRISYDNSNYNEIIYTPDQIKQMNFECHGRVVKNLSMTI